MKIEKRLIKGFDSSVTGDGDSRVIFLTRQLTASGSRD
jgi:hypothetical protein